MKRLAPALLVLLMSLSHVPSTAAKKVSLINGPKKGVTQTMTVFFNAGNCAGNQTVQITQLMAQYERNKRTRRVPTIHLRAVEFSRKCNDDRVEELRDRTRKAVFGCEGRCSWKKSEAVSTTMNWPYVMRLSGGINYVGTSVHGHVTNRAGEQLTTICSRKAFEPSNPPTCQ